MNIFLLVLMFCIFVSALGKPVMMNMAVDTEMEQNPTKTGDSHLVSNNLCATLVNFLLPIAMTGLQKLFELSMTSSASES